MKANEYRTNTCNELRLEDVGKEVRLAGWVQKIRNLGKMTFVDLRDEFGITQIIISDDEKLQKQIIDLKTECTISVTGKVTERTSKNKEIPTGDIEIIAEEIRILGKCRNVLPFEVNQKEAQEVREDLRLEYRFLDLRNDDIHKNILLRSQILKTMRDEMDRLRIYRNSNTNTSKLFTRRS